VNNHDMEIGKEAASTRTAASELKLSSQEVG
jgi:hypothetical protein